ncbi:hypothetical protein KKF84_14645 [Myxococcota bacterium]|nr:hypothetical protein [Myxococcota bacterium]MBU1536561.1 hypothetical protein [Myxococcota bacterium]
MSKITNKNEVTYQEALTLAREKYLFQIHETWLHIQQLVRGFSYVGLLITTLFGLAAYILFSASMTRFIFMSAAMGSLVTASVGINIATRLTERKSVPYVGALLFLAVVIASLLAGFIKGKEFGVTNLWPPLASSLYSSIMIGILWRLRATALEFKKIEALLRSA